MLTRPKGTPATYPGIGSGRTIVVLVPGPSSLVRPLVRIDFSLTVGVVSVFVVFPVDFPTRTVRVIVANLVKTGLVPTISFIGIFARTVAA